jgi:hypothetical protein
MNSTAYHPVNDPIVGRRATRYGAVVAGIALAVAGAVTLTAALSAGDSDPTQPAARLDRPPDVISQQAATDTMITRTHGNRTTAGDSTSGNSPATDTMITRTHGNRSAAPAQASDGRSPA